MTRIRIGLALAGFLAAVLAVALDDERIAWVGITLLGLSLIIRLVSRNRTS